MAQDFDGEVAVYAHGFQFAEGPAFDAQGRLYVTDGHAGALWRVDSDGSTAVIARPTGPNGSAFHWNGDCYVTDPPGQRIARVTPDGQVHTVADNCDGESVGTPNDLTFHPSGSIYFTSPAGSYSDPDCPPAKVYRIDPNGTVTVVLEGLRYPNGVNVNADGSVLFVAETHKGHVHAYDIEPEGSLAPRRLLADLREGQDNWWGPDGMCLDVEGNLYVALYSAGRVRRLTPDGAIDLDIRVPDPHTTNCCFGGPNNDQLFITTGQEGRVFRADIGIPGLPLFGK